MKDKIAQLGLQNQIRGNELEKERQLANRLKVELQSAHER